MGRKQLAPITRKPLLSYLRPPLGLLTVLAGMSLLIAWLRPHPPLMADNACRMLADRPEWYRSVAHVVERWGVPIHLQLAFVHQESGFRATARPARKQLLGFVPTVLTSTAYGYAQAIDTTWQRYQEATGRNHAERADFADAVDFIGWYVTLTHRRLGIRKDDAYRQYLAYHEGQTGVELRTHRRKPWLQHVARRVASQAERYRTHLRGCRGDLDRRAQRWSLFPK